MLNSDKNQKNTNSANDCTNQLINITGLITGSVPDPYPGMKEGLEPQFHRDFLHHGSINCTFVSEHYTMEIVNEKAEHYALDHSCQETPILQKINRETHAKVLSPRMLSGPLQGSFLRILSASLRPSSILEIGTYTGYSAICLAMGLAETGKLITIDINEELEKMVRGFFAESGFGDKIDYRIGNALNLIPQLNEPFDLVFIDADKRNYSTYFDLVIDKVRPGGLILADNVLWSGKVFDLNKNTDQDTQLIHAFNKKVNEDPRVETMLLPLRDGLLLIRKK